MEEAASLRRAAPSWSLAGDQRLLQALQGLHQSIISKCEATDARLGEMVAALTHASVSLQNVNNKFMALSNSQFIESRVYDDEDTAGATATAAKEPPPPSTQSELDIIKHSLRILEDLHEPVAIIGDSDSDDDDDDKRLVLKPKDLYSERRLPHIIGTSAWKSKWHAGLLPSGSDSNSDSETSLPPEARNRSHREQYSDSEPESFGNIQDTTISSGASSYAPTQTAPTNNPTIVPTSGQSVPLPPAVVAARLAQRLSGSIPQQEIPSPEEEEPPAPVVRKTYRPHQPSAGTIFPDEPPPLSASSSSEDIFAELHRGQQIGRSVDQPVGTVDLFGTSQPTDLFDDDDVFGAVNEPPQPAAPAKQKSTLFEDESEPELFVDANRSSKREGGDQRNEEIDRVKKPVGGISLFGAKTSESIGAAILQRNRQQSSDDDDDDVTQTRPDATREQGRSRQDFDRPETRKDTVRDQGRSRQDREVNKEVMVKKIAAQIDKSRDKIPQSKEAEMPQIKQTEEKSSPQTKEEKIEQNTQRDIFDDLFARSEKLQKEKSDVKKQVEKKKDLFNDDIFDDIDDIFTSNIVKDEKKDMRKPLFEDEDLFAGISVTKTDKNVSESKDSKDKVSQSIFDSDDDLFTENVEPKPQTIFDTGIYKVDTKANVKEKSLFDCDNDDDIFTMKSESTKIKFDEIKPKTNKNIQSNENSKEVEKHIEQNDIFNDNDGDIFSKDQRTIETKSPVVKTQLFEDDDDVNSFKDKLFTQTILKDTKIVSDSEEQRNETKTLEIIKNEEKTLEGDNWKDSKVTKKVDEELILTQKEVSHGSENENTTEDDWDTSDQIDEKEQTSTKSHKPSEALNAQDIFNEVDIFASLGDSKFKEPVKKCTLTSDEDNITIPNDKPSVARKPVLANDSSAKPDSLQGIDEQKAATVIDNSKAKSDTIKGNDTAKMAIGEIESNRTRKITPDNMKDVDLNKNMLAQTNIEPNLEAKNEIDDIFQDKRENDEDKSEKLTTDEENDTFDDIFKKTSSLSESRPKSDPFADIFETQPPVFEKPKERKRSKNVNALFDDDSDDEALFFKKNDVVLHDHPDQFSPSTPSVGNDRFEIFFDEPPAIDVDFVQKESKCGVVGDIDFEAAIDKDHVQQKVEKSSNKDTDHEFGKAGTKDRDDIMYITPNRNKNNILSDSDDFSESMNLVEDQSNKLSEMNTQKSFKDKIDDFDSIFKDPINILNDEMKKEVVSDNVTIEDNIVDDKVVSEDKMVSEDKTDGLPTETKKVGKLKPMNFNINVNTLLPGASPKKTQKPHVDEQTRTEYGKHKDVQTKAHADEQKTFKDEHREEQTKTQRGFEHPDGQMTQNIINRDVLTKAQKLIEQTDGQSISAPNDLEENKDTKSKVSFDNDSLLDNKFSKERAKIQVKRRPSTRRARREAVKKSGIDFGEDTLDADDSLKNIDDTTTQAPTNEVADTDTTSSTQRVKNTDDTISLSQPFCVPTAELQDDKDDFQTVVSCVSNKATTETDGFDRRISSKNNLAEDIATGEQTETVNIHSRIKLGEDVITKLEQAEEINSVDRNLESPKSPTKDFTSKVVYVLNDEDIFNTKSESKVQNSDSGDSKTVAESRSRKQILNVIDDDDDDDDIFKTMIPKQASIQNPKDSAIKKESKPFNVLNDDDDDLFKKHVLKTEQSLKDSKRDSFDEDIFKASKKKTPANVTTEVSKANASKLDETLSKQDISRNKISSSEVPKANVSKIEEKLSKPATSKKSIFDDLSDGENELFNKGKKEPKVSMNKALFGSDSEEELFSGNVKRSKQKEQEIDKRKEVDKNNPETDRKEVKIQVEKKFVKKSLFEDDDDDDLFGPKKKKNTVAGSKPTSTSSAPSKPAKSQTVFDDPLSLFGDDG